MDKGKLLKKQEKKIESSKVEVAKLKEEIDELRNKYLRALADYQNLEKRVEKEKIDFQKKANKNLILKFLEVLDDLERGEKFISDSGLKLIKEKFIKILEEEGVREIEVLGKVFNPQVAECIEVVEGKRDNIVVEVLRKGYTLNGEVIRVARVKVEKLKSKT